MTTKVAIIGSRDFPDLDLVREWMWANLTPRDTVISGGARGVDRAAEACAEQIGCPVISIPPDYEKYGAAAPLVRNTEIVNDALYVVAFWDGESRGTMHAVRQARRLGKGVKIIRQKLP